MPPAIVHPVYRWFGKLKGSENWVILDDDTNYEPGKESVIANLNVPREVDGAQFKCAVIDTDSNSVLAESTVATLTVIDPVWVEKITINHVSSQVHAQSSLLMRSTVKPDNASIKDMHWSVADGTGSATIDESSGILTGDREGTVTVTVTATATDGSGTFNGQGHTVTLGDLSLISDNSLMIGLFGDVGNNENRTIIRGLNIVLNGELIAESPRNKLYDFVGTLAGRVFNTLSIHTPETSMLSNSYNRGDITITAASNASPEIYAGGSITGDVFKSLSQSCKVENTYSAGSIKLSESLAGSPG